MLFTSHWKAQTRSSCPSPEPVQRPRVAELGPSLLNFRYLTFLVKCLSLQTGGRSTVGGRSFCGVKKGLCLRDEPVKSYESASSSTVSISHRHSTMRACTAILRGILGTAAEQSKHAPCRGSEAALQSSTWTFSLIQAPEPLKTSGSESHSAKAARTCCQTGTQIYLCQASRQAFPRSRACANQHGAKHRARSSYLFACRPRL